MWPMTIIQNLCMYVSEGRVIIKFWIIVFNLISILFFYHFSGGLMAYSASCWHTGTFSLLGADAVFSLPTLAWWYVSKIGSTGSILPKMEFRIKGRNGVSTFSLSSVRNTRISTVISIRSKWKRKQL